MPNLLQDQTSFKDIESSFCTPNNMKPYSFGLSSFQNTEPMIQSCEDVWSTFIDKVAYQCTVHTNL